MAYDFLKNVENHIKKPLIGQIISSLQKPMKDVIRRVCDKQIKDVNSLIEVLKNKE